MHSTVCTLIDLFTCVCHILLINYYYSARPVDLDGVIKDFVSFNDQLKDDFGLQTSKAAMPNSLTLAMCQWLCYSVNV